MTKSEKQLVLELEQAWDRWIMQEEGGAFDEVVALTRRLIEIAHG